MRILLIIFLFAAQVSAQQISYKKGVVTDSLFISDTLKESYALYLPTRFDGKTGLPVIFVFDGQGRGKTAARLFQPAAEEQGYIIVSSNDVDSTKSLEGNLNSAIRLVQEVSQRIPMDFKSISYAGFADGAKVATYLPLVFNDTHGVIYVGDQFFDLELVQKGKPFTAVGVVGNRQVDLGIIELVDLRLRDLGFPGVLYVFEGESEWPNLRVISSAVGNLTLEAIKARKRPHDEDLVKELYQQDLQRAELLISADNYVMAQNFLESLLLKYKGVTTTAEVKEMLKQLRRSSNFKEQREHYQEILEKEERLWNDFIYYYNEDIARANFENLGWWNYQKMELTKLTMGEDKLEAAMAFRLLDLLKKMSQSRLLDIEEEKNTSSESRLFAYMLATIFDPSDFESYKKVISLSTMQNDYATALFYLEEMLKNGYKDMDALYEIEGTLGLKLSREFNWLIKKYLGSSRYFENASSLY